MIKVKKVRINVMFQKLLIVIKLKFIIGINLMINIVTYRSVFRTLSKIFS